MRRDILELNGLMTEPELDFLSKVARMSVAPEYGYALEIGTFNGLSTAVICDAIDHGWVISVDNYGMKHHGPNNIELARKNLAALGFHPTLIQQKSPLDQVLLNKLVKPDGIAFLFIDGHHSPTTLVAEMVAYGPYFNDTIVALHDYGRSEYPGFTKGIDKLFESWENLGLAESLIAFRQPEVPSGQDEAE